MLKDECVNRGCSLVGTTWNNGDGLHLQSSKKKKNPEYTSEDNLSKANHLNRFDSNQKKQL
jgi:hypothetical protein